MSRSQYPLADRLVGGNLDQRLACWRAEGLSFHEIAFRLREHGVTVTGETVRRWSNELAEPEPAA